MNKLTALIQSGLALLCLLLTLPCAQLTAQTELCPPYPRAMDQAFVCIKIKNNEISLKLDPKAGLHNPVRFVFPSFTPDPAITVTTLNVDFGDGMGSRTITSGSTYTITYPTPGQYTLTYNGFVLGGSGNRPLAGSMVFQSNQNPTFSYPVTNADETWGDVTSNAFTPPAGNYYPAGSPYNQPVTAGGLVHIRYANPDKQLRKPFILVEGFDPVLNKDKYKVVDAAGQPLGYGSLRWDVVVTGRNESFDEDPNEAGVPHTPQFALLPILVDAIISKGYDLVYVDLADGATYMQANGDFLIKVIERVNSEKITSEENVLLGGSMGGILGRYALAKMEQEGKSHCTGLLFTLDSPHNGANIPLSVQAFGWFFHATGEREDAWAALNTPAARQMLITNLGTEIANGTVWFDNLFGEYTTPLSFDELTQYDYSGMRGQWLNALSQVGWPKMPRKVALLDGMKDGTALSNQGFGPSSEFFSAEIWGYPPSPGPVQGLNLSMRSNSGGGTETQGVSAFTDCEASLAVAEPTSNYLFTAAVPHDMDPCMGQSTPHLYHAVSLETNGSLPYLDNAPGSCRLDLRAVRALLKEKAEEGGNIFVRECSGILNRGSRVYL